MFTSNLSNLPPGCTDADIERAQGTAGPWACQNPRCGHLLASEDDDYCDDVCRDLGELDKAIRRVCSLLPFTVDAMGRAGTLGEEFGKVGFDLMEANRDNHDDSLHYVEPEDDDDEES